MRIVQKTQFIPIEITLETVEEITQLYAVLNFAPVLKVINSGGTNWNKLREVLYEHEVNYHPWHEKLLAATRRS